MSSQLNALDEFPILEIPKTPLWSENYAMMFGDPVTRTSIFYICGRWVLDPTIWRELIGIVLPDQRVLSAKNYGRNASSAGPGASLSSLEIVEPERKVRLRFEGPALESESAQLFESAFGEGMKKPCKVDIVFDAISPLLNMKGDSKEASAIAGSLHIDQIGAASGTITYDGAIHSFKNAYSVRDHSRGIRDISKYGRHCWLNGHVPGNRFFYLYVMGLQGGEGFGMSNAVVIDGGRSYAAELVESDLLDEPTNPKKLHTFVLDSELGEMRFRVKEVLTTFPNSILAPFEVAAGWIKHLTSGLMLDQFVMFECNGECGMGWNERGLASAPL